MQRRTPTGPIELPTLITSLFCSGFPDRDANAYLTNTPALTMRAGIRIAHKKPITDCLYLI